MKRIVLCAAACLLLIACGKPKAAETAEAVSAQQSESATAVETEDVVEIEEISLSNTTEAARPATVPGPTEGTVADAKTAEPTAAPTLPPAPPEIRFPGKFSETKILDDEARTYKSSTIDISIKVYNEKNTYSKRIVYYVADIYVADVTSIRTAAARGDFGMRYERRVREIASDAGAILAIDGDTYTHVEKSFVIRNGVLYRDTPIKDTDICILYRDGTMETKKWGTFTAQEVIASDPWQVWGFGPALLDEEGHAISIEHKLSGHNPRAAIGYYEPGHYCFVIVDGQRGKKDSGSDGIRLSALSQLMADLGCKVAYNLDGGDSAQMYWNGKIINKTKNESRVISDIIYILPEG